ncbi:hypothetical protein ACFLQI_02100 [Candidatus Undinarchaeota archaeon]
MTIFQIGEDKRDNEEILKDLGCAVAESMDKLCAEYDEEKGMGCSCLRAKKIKPFSSCLLWAPILWNVSNDKVELKDEGDLKTFLYSAAKACNMPLLELNEYLQAYVTHEMDVHKGSVKGDLLAKDWELIKGLCEKVAKEKKK